MTIEKLAEGARIEPNELVTVENVLLCLPKVSEIRAA
jgi:hypothetical protein